jgi:hypothetical protein
MCNEALVFRAFTFDDGMCFGGYNTSVPYALVSISNGSRAKLSKKKVKNIQQLGFANGHPLNY